MVVRFLVCAIAGGIVIFVLGFLIYGLALAGWIQANTVQYPGLILDPPNFVALAISNIVWAGMIAFVADNWANARNFGAGMKVGGILMFFSAMAVNLQNTAFMNIFENMLVPVVDVAGVTFMGVFAGGVIGFILGKMTK
ncbi:MAG: hypothetical protein IPM63_07795 [Acidobacteriota bacterium]|nr:MAG: hypothetical protein IPM63_07795 [Acidobacteriota bacterium]